ncbi:acetolactate synthase, large subunit, biosynthetic type [Candidatus Gottesmanbacteria bacterium RIFCSPLOWO2_01_FULL_39_12b]|uniref:Acetolactate synthase n=1 Tax=Candidatus Gottesmanbacteria bacterium RIFCSPLOWO2_01_FULL_39_12b TaxID=1798388 RepID=A0A1F6ANX6_9BACT|nr:MAG: acetolactate synthase, large subunit, biosynthetic type [Candidatus Gottesmanbacteria bacterium RIFCSPLOWO2_01_FULL_39_12b]
MKKRLKEGQKATGAEIVCEALLREGTDIIFGYPGGAIMPVYDALLKYPQLHHILVRHEQGAAHAAEGFARVTGKPGVCLVTSGPGATNLVTGLADAMMDSVPIVCISGQVISSLIGNDAFQETDVVGVTAMVTKHNYLVIKPEEIAETIKEAFHLARTGRPGPVMIDIAKDAQQGITSFSYSKEITLPGYRPTITGNPKQVKRAAEIINKSLKPFILAGHGILISHAEKELAALAEKSHIPVATTLHGISSIPRDHRCYVGMLGMHGNLSPNKCTNEADVIIALGMRFDDRVTGKISGYARRAKVIHIDIDPAELNKNVPAEVPIVGDVKHVLQQLNPLISKADHKDWFVRFKEYDKLEFEKVIKNEVYPKTGQIKMGEVIRRLSEETKGQAIVVADVGQNQMFAARYYDFKVADSFITSGGLGTMGFALPAGAGAKIGRPNQEVWVITGDGGFQMKIQEMATIFQENINLKIAILNNNYLGMVRQWQHLFFDKKYSEVFLRNPNFIKLSEGFGIPAEKVDKRNNILPAIKRARKHKGPYLIEFVVETEANVFPMMPAGAAVDEIRLE